MRSRAPRSRRSSPASSSSPRSRSQAWTAGAKVYWDNTAKRATNVASGNTLIGVAVLAVGAGADEVVGRVRLNGSF